MTPEQIQRIVIARRESIDKHIKASEIARNLPAGKNKDDANYMAAIYFGQQKAYENVLDICGIPYFG